MDLSAVLVSLCVAGIALLPRIPGFSADERRRAQLQGDAALWKAMPDGVARDALAEQIGAATRQMLKERARDRTLWQGWLYGSGWVFVGWVLLVASESVPDQTSWARNWGVLFVWTGLAAGLSGALLMAGVAVAWMLRTITPVLAYWAARIR